MTKEHGSNHKAFSMPEKENNPTANKVPYEK
jgi:hypothetical protein